MIKSYRSKPTSTLTLSLAIAASGLTAGYSSPNQAQEFDEFIDELPVLEEIIVTARKRQESIQDSPVAVSAFSAEALQEAGITNTRDLQSTVPGLMFSEQGTKNPSIYIRGVGQRESVASLDPGVGVYINGIYIPRTDSQMLDTLDTQSIQVLRGPQGTLFGKNNTGGAILITTNQPHNEGVEGYVTARLGDYGRRDLMGAVNLPINEDSLAVRLSATSIKRDGYMESIVDDKEYGDQDRLSLSARVFWQVNDIMSVDYFSFWSKQNELGVPLNCFWANNPDANMAQFTFSGNKLMQTSCEASEQLAGKNKVSMNGPTKFKIDNAINALTLAWEFDDYEVKSVTAFNEQSDIARQDDHDAVEMTVLHGGGLGLTGIPRTANESSRTIIYPEETRSQFSQELQLIGSAFDESLQFTVGAFYAKEKMKNVPFTSLVGENSFARLQKNTQIPSDWLSPAMDAFPIWGIHTFLGTQSNLTNETIAIFAQGTYDITDWWQITLGGRYTVENRERDVTTYDTNLEQLVTQINSLQHEGITGAADVKQIIACTDEAPNELGLCGRKDISELIPDENEPLGFTGYPSVDVYNAIAEYYANVGLDNSNTSRMIPLTVTDMNTNPALGDDDSWKKFTPTFTTSFDLPEEMFDNSNMDAALLYLTLSRGFKSGGFENKSGTLTKFEPEVVDNIEFGFKLDAFEQRMRFNAALYQMKYKDIQIRVAEQGRNLSEIVLYIDNAGEATINGFEMELALLPIDNLTLTATANYTDASYDEFKIDTLIDGQIVPDYDRSDEDFGSIPEFTGSLVVSYDWATDYGMIIPRFTAYHRDEIYTGIDYISPEFDVATIDAYTLYNLRVAYIPAELDSLNVTLFVDNLTDEDYFQGGFTVAASMGAATLSKGPPRTMGLEANYTF